MWLVFLIKLIFYKIYILKERYNYQDPVTEFLSCLYIDFDFDAAQTKLRECDSV